MSDTIGRITVPTPTASGLTFPLISEFGYGMVRPWPVITHRFGEFATKAEQRFQVGFGPRKFPFRRSTLPYYEEQTLFSFFESVQGSFQSFTYNAPLPDKTTTPYSVIFEDAPLSYEALANSCRTGFNFIECPDPSAAPDLTVNSVCLRFPSAALQTALLSQVQKIVPLVHIRVRESAVPDIWLSDRRVTLADGAGGAVQSAMGWASSSQLYLPRILGLGEKGSEVIISQDIKGTADNVQFTFGNADRVMSRLSNDTDLKYASIDLCIYHVNSGILLQLWKGFIINFTSDGSPLFPVQCSDGIYQVTQQYPDRTVSRTCWKDYNVAPNCPWAIAGASAAAVIAAGGDPNSCDFYFDSANGCKVHGMTKYFGGHPLLPQSAYLRNNQNKLVGVSQGTVTATSIVSDTMWGKALPDIWCNQQNSALYAFYANAIVADVREDQEFFQVLGIIGSGPLYAYTVQPGFGGVMVTNADGFTFLVAPLADGFPVAGLALSNAGTTIKSDNPSGNLRQSLGTDPTDQSAVDDTFALQAGGQLGEPNRAAGTAFVELIYSKNSDLTQSIPDSHSMTVPIAQGLTGFKWDANGNRSAAPGLINPFWIAVNTLIRALGLNGASSAAQLNTFVLSSLFAGDGSGAAEIADTLVTPILGSGTEIQFQFQGTIAQQKALRDWLTEILACALGYYTWEFGRLRLGCRINASATEAFTIGNMLYRSLRLTPIDAAFEHLIIYFADVAYQFQQNYGDYVDKTHAAYYGRPGSPLNAPQNIVGCSTLSQALRLAATRVREEIGGVNPTEWRKARNATFKTTILGLNTYAGQVISITDPDVPGYRGVCNVSGTTVTFVSGDGFDYTLMNKDAIINGALVTIINAPNASAGLLAGGSIVVTPAPPGGAGVPFQIITGDFRILSWRMMKDWSIEIQAKTVTPSMYDLDVGPKPYDVVPVPLPVIFYPVPLGVWAPWQIQAAAGDALFPNEFTFDSDQMYTQQQDGTIQASVTATGVQPVNAFYQGAGALVIGSITQSTTGGGIPGGVTLRVALCAISTTGVPTPPSNIAIIQVPAGTNTNSFTLHDIVWPNVGSLAHYALFASTQDDLISTQLQGNLSGTGPYTPTSITYTGGIARSTWGIPNGNVQKVRIKQKLLRHSGVLGVPITSVATNQVVIAEMVDPSMTPFDPTGRVLSVIGRPNASTPFASFNITAINHTTGTLTLDRDPTGIIGVDDAVTIRNKADNLTGTPASVTVVNDNGYKNNINSYSGLTPSAEVGNLIRVLANTGRGQPPSTITANTATQITFSPALTMDDTSVWIIEAPTWTFQSDSTTIDNAAYATPVSLVVPTVNYIQQPVLIGGFLVDVNGNESPEGDGPLREDWIYGQVGAISGSMTIVIPGTLAIGSDLGPAAFYPTSVTLGSGVTGVVKDAPTGADIVVTIYAGLTLLFTLTITNGTTLGTASGTPAIPADTNVVVNITAVGTTFPGSGLTLNFS